MGFGLKRTLKKVKKMGTRPDNPLGIITGGWLHGAVTGSTKREDQAAENQAVWEQQTAYNEQMWEKQKAYEQEMWNKQNQYNTPKEQMLRMKEAGLNPNLMYGQGNVGNAGAVSVSRPEISEKRAVEVPDSGERILGLVNAVLSAYSMVSNLGLARKAGARADVLGGLEAQLKSEQILAARSENEWFRKHGGSRFESPWGRTFRDIGYEIKGFADSGFLFDDFYKQIGELDRRTGNAGPRHQNSSRSGDMYWNGRSWEKRR